MNIRRSGSSQQLITQPAHAVLAARIMRQWEPSHFPDSSRKSSILKAVEHHDTGWAEVDAYSSSTTRLNSFLISTNCQTR